jgi:hypothetical protein
MRSMLTVAVLFAGSLSLHAQTAPVKMGLWEKTIVTSMGEGAPTTVTAKSCVTQQQWQEMVANAQKPHEGCKMNQVKTANGYTFNGTCNLPGGTSMVMNGSQTIQDSEHIVSDSHSTATTNGKTRKIDTHSVSRFVSSSCGSLKPGDTE